MITNRRARFFTFADKVAVGIHEADIFGDFVVDRFVLGETIEAQVGRHLVQLLVGHLSAEKFAQLVHFPFQILMSKMDNLLTPITGIVRKGRWKRRRHLIYSFEVFVEYEVHVRMVAQVPGLEDVREVGRAEELVFHEVLGERLQIAGELEEVDQPVEVEVGDDDVLGVARHVHHLRLVQHVRMQQVERQVGFDDARLVHLPDLVQIASLIAPEEDGDLFDEAAQHRSDVAVVEHVHDRRYERQLEFPAHETETENKKWVGKKIKN